MDETGDDKSESTPEFCIDAFSSGNVTRYINHSCQPNLFVQCVLSEHHNIKLARIVLFAADNIPPLQVLSLSTPNFLKCLFLILNRPFLIDKKLLYYL